MIEEIGTHTAVDGIIGTLLPKQRLGRRVVVSRGMHFQTVP